MRARRSASSAALRSTSRASATFKRGAPQGAVESRRRWLFFLRRRLPLTVVNWGSILPQLSGLSKISARAPPSGNAATHCTHQVGSRHAGCATPGAFRHRKHAHERHARARLCQLFRRLALPACMQRSGAELPLCTWSGCGGRLNGVAVVTGKRGGGGDATHCALSRCPRRWRRS